MRPRKGQTNYLSRGKEDKQAAFSIQGASQGQDGLEMEESVEEDANPWDDGKAVEKLKATHNLSDADIQERRQRHAGITPDVLARAISQELSDEAVVEAIQQHQAQQMEGKFDSNEAARSMAMRQQQGQTSSATSKSRPLRPFPENPSFVSQPVLSEELREIIYLKVVRDGLTVRTVSTLMGVSMERVGAVVRMKQMERDWVKDVSFLPFFFPLSSPSHHGFR